MAQEKLDPTTKIPEDIIVTLFLAVPVLSNNLSRRLLLLVCANFQCHLLLGYIQSDGRVYPKVTSERMTLSFKINLDKSKKKGSFAGSSDKVSLDLQANALLSFSRLKVQHFAKKPHPNSDCRGRFRLDSRRQRVKILNFAHNLKMIKVT